MAIRLDLATRAYQKCAREAAMGVLLLPVDHRERSPAPKVGPSWAFPVSRAFAKSSLLVFVRTCETLRLPRRSMPTRRSVLASFTALASTRSLLEAASAEQ